MTGKPVGTGGELGGASDGHGVAFLAFRALEALEIPPAGATAIVQGFGNVGSHAALGLEARGVELVGVSDHLVAYYDPKGLDTAGWSSTPRKRARSLDIRAKP